MIYCDFRSNQKLQVVQFKSKSKKKIKKYKLVTTIKIKE